MPCTVIIVHYGGPERTLDQVRRVRDWARQVVVVSNDGVEDQWFESDRAICWRVPSRNLGYGGGVNFAMQFASEPVVAVLNTDIVVPETVARRACGVVLKGMAAVVGLAMHRPDGRFLSGAGSLSRCLRLGRMSEPEQDLTYCEWVTGAAMFVSLPLLEEIGFDERYFLGMEDVDLCVRASRKGLRVAVLNDGDVIHDSGAVVGAARWYYYTTRNPIWFLRTERNLAWSLVLALRACALLARVLVADIVLRRGLSRSRLMALGVWHGLSLNPAPGSAPQLWEPVGRSATGGEA